MTTFEELTQQEIDSIINELDSIIPEPQEWLILQTESKYLGRLKISIKITGKDENGIVRYGLFKDNDQPFNFEYKEFIFCSPTPSNRTDLYYKHYRRYSKEECFEAFKKFMKENPTYLNRWIPKKVKDVPSYHIDDEEGK